MSPATARANGNLRPSSPDSKHQAARPAGPGRPQSQAALRAPRHPTPTPWAAQAPRAPRQGSGAAPSGSPYSTRPNALPDKVIQTRLSGPHAPLAPDPVPESSRGPLGVQPGLHTCSDLGPCGPWLTGWAVPGRGAPGRLSSRPACIPHFRLPLAADKVTGRAALCLCDWERVYGPWCLGSA